MCILSVGTVLFSWLYREHFLESFVENRQYQSLSVTLCLPLGFSNWRSVPHWESLVISKGRHTTPHNVDSCTIKTCVIYKTHSKGGSANRTCANVFLGKHWYTYVFSFLMILSTTECITVFWMSKSRWYTNYKLEKIVCSASNNLTLVTFSHALNWSCSSFTFTAVMQRKQFLFYDNQRGRCDTLSIIEAECLDSRNLLEYLETHSLKSRRFWIICLDMLSVHKTIIFCNKVRWLSKGCAAAIKEKI